tara:strand:- start:13914 stop:14651 length:738 start_codon:yes stop_codon:yes gene_type:complete
MAGVRLDERVIALGFAATRGVAESLIRTGKVLVDDAPVEKPGTKISETSEVRIRVEAKAFVSRGGLKLSPALDTLNIDPVDKWCVDIGASTGGFTDCLLQRGAKGVVAVDVGYGQLNEKLRTDARVRVLDRKNARYLGLEDLPENPLLATIDVSFISTTLILPALALAAPNAALVVMVKPQFELDRAKVGKGGVVRDDRLRYQALAKVVNKANDLGFTEVGHVESELPGPKGNREIFAHFVRENP